MASVLYQQGRLLGLFPIVGSLATTTVDSWLASFDYLRDGLFHYVLVEARRVLVPFHFFLPFLDAFVECTPRRCCVVNAVNSSLDQVPFVFLRRTGPVVQAKAGFRWFFIPT